MVNEATILQMIDKVDDPKIKNVLNNVVNGRIVTQIRCLSEVCKGKVIGHIYHDGQVIEVSSMNDNGVVSGVLSSRKRFDGYMGFRCACMNNSILCEAEDGIIADRVPTKDDLAEIAESLKRNPPKYFEKNNAIEIDGFIMEKFRPEPVVGRINQ